MNRYAGRMASVNKSFIREILKVTADPAVISFAGGLPNPASFPVEAIRAACDRVLAREGASVLQYSTTEGYAPLREWIAARYAAKGMRARAEDILITAGAQQGLDLIGKVFLDRGDAVVMEQPGYLGAIQSFSMFEPRFLPVPLEADGVDIPALGEALRAGPKLFYAVPNFQNPSGITYSAEKRRRAAALLKDSDTVFIEDDPYGELRFMGEAAPSMGTLLGQNLLLLGSFSKIFSPAMRLGWICAPGETMEKLIVAKQASDLHTNYFSQRILYEYLDTNDIDAHIGAIRGLYKRQRDAMTDAVRRWFPAGVRCTEPEGGMFLWASLPEGMSAVRLFEAAIERRVAFVPGDPFYTGAAGTAGTDGAAGTDKTVSAFRLNYTNSSEEDIERGIRTLSDVIRAQMP